MTNKGPENGCTVIAEAVDTQDGETLLTKKVPCPRSSNEALAVLEEVIEHAQAVCDAKYDSDGKARVGYSRKYAENYAATFGQKPEAMN